MASNKISIIDVHAHVQFEQYDKDREDVVMRSLDAGIGMINAGADLKTSQNAVNLAHKYEDGVWATVGIHPTEIRIYTDKNADKHGYISDNLRENPFESAMREIEILAHDEKVVGIGECGLDYHSQINADMTPIDADTKTKQEELFVRHIEISNRTKKPLVIHCREAFDDIIELLETNRSILLPEPGILHFFTGTIEEAQKLLNLNFSFTFGGLITFNRSFDDIIKTIPLEKIMIETDAPYVSPKSHRGQRNEPYFITETLAMLSAIRMENEDDVRVAVLENTHRLFFLK
jgi:TatD DNase family protein